MSSSNNPAPIIRHYVDLPRPLSQALAVAAAQEGVTKKKIIERLIEQYLSTPAKGKK